MQQLDQQINLYRRPTRQKATAFSSKSSGLVLAAGVAGLLLVQLYGQYLLQQQESTFTRGKQQVALLKEQIETIKKKQKPKENELLKTQVLNTTRMINNNKRMFSQLRSIMDTQSVFAVEYLRSLAKTSPQGVWLTGITTTATGNVQLSGNAMSPAQVPMLIQSLSSEKAFQGLTFETIEVTKNKTGNHIGFHVSSGGFEEDKP